MNFQKYTDKLLAATVLPFVPKNITPNQVSVLRILSIPFIYYFLTTENYFWGLILFSTAALTDALDGAMARTRDQITEVGKVLDAVADKGLIALVAFVFIPQYFGWPLLVTMLVLELINGAASYRATVITGKNTEANWAGKIKMIIQCAAFIALFIGILNDSPIWLSTAEILLYASLPFNLIQSFLYPTQK